MTWENPFGVRDTNLVRLVWSHKSLKSIFYVIRGKVRGKVRKKALGSK